MGWRDINMNRRKPPLRLAAIPVEDGQDLRAAVLHKACGAAVAALAQAEALTPRLRPFAAGYAAGFARHQALKHGIDAEQDGLHPLQDLLQQLAALSPPFLAEDIAALRFLPRPSPGKSPRTSLRAATGLADAGYLVGHLESLCGSRRLLQAAAGAGGSAERTEAFLTACDTAADRLQTHQPTMSLRFDAAEREILRAAFR